MKGGANGMKKVISVQAQAKEAAFWSNIKKMMQRSSGKVCHK